MKSKIRGTLSAIIIILLIAQPLFDVYMAIVGEKLDVLGISIVTLIRTITAASLFIAVAIYQIKNKYKTKLLVGISIYLSLVVIYALGHHFNIYLSNGYFVSKGLYNGLTELMYVLRLVMPIILIYILVLAKPKREHIEKIMVTVVLIISLVIIFSNIFKISFASYSPENDIIKYNVFDWFDNSIVPYDESLSKGLFVSANQIGALLAILLPVVIMNAIRHNKIYTYFVLLLQVISMVLVGTRVANYGFILVTILMAGSSVIICIAKHKKVEITRILAILVIMAIGLVIYSKSPARSRVFLDDTNDLYIESDEDKINNDKYITIEAFKEMLKDEVKMRQYMNYSLTKELTIDELKHEAMCKYIKENSSYHAITEKYIVTIYPYEEDPEFWLDVFEKPLSVKSDNRARQSVIIRRIKELNNNYIADTLLGMGATPMNAREYMIENDLISHYYNIGVIGIIIFVAPYGMIVLCALILEIIRQKNKINIRIIAYCLSVGMTYGVGYFAGHVIDEYIITIFVATIAGLIVNELNITEGLNERYNA